MVDLERTFYYLEQQNATDFATWEVRYVLLLWLSIIILVPFDLKIIDSSAENQQTLAARMINEAKNYLRDSGKSREAAALFLAKLLTRPDLDNDLVEFMKWANQTLIDATDHYMVNRINTYSKVLIWHMSFLDLGCLWKPRWNFPIRR